MDAVQQQRYADTSASIATTTYWKANPGTNRIRLLPQRPDIIAATGEQDIMRRVKVHFKVGPNQRACGCNKDLNQPCAVCDYIEQQIAAGNGGTVEVMQASMLFEFNILNLAPPFTAEAPEHIAQLWAASPAQTQQILHILTDPEWGDIAHPQTGCVCIVDKTTKGNTAKYDIRFSREPYPIDMTKVKYATARAYLNYEDQQRLLSGEEVMRSSTPTAKPAAAQAPVAAPVPAAPTVTVPPPTPAAAPVPASPVPAPTPVAAPVPPTPPVPATPIAAPPPVTPPVPVTMWWVAIDGAAKEMDAASVKAHLATGVTANALAVMTHDRSSGWKTAADFPELAG